MAIRYRYKVYTTKCPYCGAVLSVDNSDQSNQLFSMAIIVTFPYYLSRFFLNKIYGNPSIPKVGPKSIVCPRCSLPMRTDNKLISELSRLELLNYQFRHWFTFSYLLGTILIASVIFVDCAKIISLPNWGYVEILLLCIVLLIVIVYNYKKSRHVIGPKRSLIKKIWSVNNK